MARHFLCPSGHRWPASADNPAAESHRCPICGGEPHSCEDTFDTRPLSTWGTVPPAAAPIVQLDPGESVEGYDILDKLGEGGMGVVFKARQRSLKRLVALKMIRRGGHASPEGLARFRIEAEAVARLQHPNIVQIYEVGEQEGRPYFSLEFVEGGSLDRKLARQPQRPREAAQAAEVLARAMHYAHSKGVIHRDLKPANVLLTADVPPLLKITDFGLAKQLDADSGQTQHGDVMGTPSYMAPEQADGRIADIGPATDVYALGAILYEMLTGRPPFQGATVVQTLEQVRSHEPVPISQIQPKVSRDLETICLKCLAKEPGRRYSSSLMLAQDLERFLAGEPILARREGPVAMLWRKARRRKAATLASLALLTAVLALATGGFVYRKARHDQELADLALKLDEGLRALDFTPEHLREMDALVEQMVPLDPGQAASARRRTDERLARVIEDSLRQPGRLLPEIVRHIDEELDLLDARAADLAEPLRRERDRRYRSWQTVFELTPPFAGRGEVFAADAVRIEQDGAPTSALVRAAAADTTLFTVARCGGDVLLEAELDASAGTASEFALLLNTMPVPRVLPTFVSPDGRSIVTGTSDGSLRMWDLIPTVARKSWKAHARGISSVVYSPDGKLVASASEDGTIKLWDTEAGTERAELPRSNLPVLCLAFSPDGKILAWGAQDGRVRLWDVAGRRERKDVRVRADARSASTPDESVHGLAFSPNGRTLALCAGLNIEWWDFPEGKLRRWSAPHGQQVTALAYTPDGERVASASRDTTAGLSDPATGKRLATLLSGGPQGLACVACSPDGAMLAAGHESGRVFVWDTITQQRRDVFVLPGRPQACRAVAYTPGGDALVAVAADGTPNVWPLTVHKPDTYSPRQGYAVVLSAAAPGRRATLGQVQKHGGDVRLQLFRGHSLLREQSVRVPAGPLRCWISREGDLLRFRVNDAAAVDFQDTRLNGLALPAGVFALHWPEGVRLLHLRASAKGPGETGDDPLQTGDQLYAGRHFEEAYAFFRRQADTAGAGEAGSATRREARFKAAQCLCQLRREEDAIALLDAVVSQDARGEDLWTVRAIFELWRLRVRRGQLAEVERLRQRLLLLYPDREQFDKVAAVVPEDGRQEISAALLDAVERQQHQLLLDPQQALSAARAAAEVTEFLRGPRELRVKAGVQLVWASRLAGEHEGARRAAAEVLRLVEEPSPDGSEVGWYWLQRTYGNSFAALERLDGWLFEGTGRLRPARGVERASLLLERARLHLALKKPQEAERDLNVLFRELSVEEVPYPRHAEACLLLGFLRARHGDETGARGAWRRGLFKSWQATLPPGSIRHHDPRFHLLQSILYSLTGDVADEEMSNFLREGTARVGDARAAQVARLLDAKPALLREMWRGRRGHEYARQCAFWELTWPELRRAALLLAGAEFFHQEALPGPLSAKQEDLLWRLTEDATVAYARGSVNAGQGASLVGAWTGNTDFLGWDSVKNSLPPSLRGPMAYVLGHRYERILHNPAKARMFFKTALEDAAREAGDEFLRELAAAELNRLRETSGP